MTIYSLLLLAYVIDKNLHHTGDIKASIKIAADILRAFRFHLQMMCLNNNKLNYEHA
jgi:hypothetical protein